ncbi:hypothetical protein GCM10007160_11000 [Litchfieldella qijiaojingensis]|uniref:Uncharacterized protein n=2 Tax=Litchfieldella qijiaojingensis TaxID=980347 RepID=A0ABQ2YIH3_9GAMM|nr:hypothetical protein GCM10007160_11000 [Halomonas qijiaojingensis]
MALPRLQNKNKATGGSRWGDAQGANNNNAAPPSFDCHKNNTVEDPETTQDATHPERATTRTGPSEMHPRQQQQHAEGR